MAPSASPTRRSGATALGIAAAIAPFVVRLVIWRRIGLGDAIEWNIIGLVFDVAVLAALLHRQSGEYQRIYFR